MTKERLTLPVDGSTEGFVKRRLSVNNAADVHFNGKLLHEYSTQNAERTKTRWTELRLWETEAGTWLAESVGYSDRQGESELRDVAIFEKKSGLDVRKLADPDFVDTSPDRRQPDVMAFFGWTVVAKAFAREAGWDVIRRID